MSGQSIGQGGGWETSTMPVLFHYTSKTKHHNSLNKHPEKSYLNKLPDITFPRSGLDIKPQMVRKGHFTESLNLV